MGCQNKDALILSELEPFGKEAPEGFIQKWRTPNLLMTFTHTLAFKIKTFYYLHTLKIKVSKGGSKALSLKNHFWYPEEPLNTRFCKAVIVKPILKGPWFT